MTVFEGLDDEHVDMLRQPCLLPSIHCEETLKLFESDILHFGLGQVAKFSLFEFALIIRLMCTSEKAAKPYISTNGRLLNQYFSGQSTVILA